MWCIFILGYLSLSARGDTKKKKQCRYKGLHGAKKVKNS